MRCKHAQHCARGPLGLLAASLRATACALPRGIMRRCHSPQMRTALHGTALHWRHPRATACALSASSSSPCPLVTCSSAAALLCARVTRACVRSPSSINALRLRLTLPPTEHTSSSSSCITLDRTRSAPVARKGVAGARVLRRRHGVCMGGALGPPECCCCCPCCCWPWLACAARRELRRCG